jgi:hypothetical protein
MKSDLEIEENIIKNSEKVIDDYLAGNYNNEPDAEKFLKIHIKKNNL